MSAAASPGGPQSGGASPPTLRPLALAGETLAVLLADGRAFVRAASMAAVALFVVEWLWIRWEFAATLSVVYGAVGLALLTSFAVACHRRVLLGIGTPTAFALSFGRREVIYAAFSLALFVVVAMSVFMFSLLGALLLAGSQSGGGGTILLAVTTMLVAVFLLARLTVVLPAVAVDRSGGAGKGFRASWASTGPVAWRLAVAYAIVAAPVYGLNWGVFAVIGPHMENLNVRGMMAVFDVAMQFLGTAVVTIFLSLVYRRLGGMGPSPAAAGLPAGPGS